MDVLGQLANFILKTNDRIKSKLKTRQARFSSTIGSGSRISASGEVINISNRPENIIIGKNCVISGQLLIFAHAGKIKIGDWVFVGRGSHIWSSKNLSIGNRVLISHGVEIHDTDSHPLNHEKRAEQTVSILSSGHPSEFDGIRASPIVIGDDVWIGFGATIKRGVTIGDRAIVGARAIVDQDIPADGMIKAISSK